MRINRGIVETAIQDFYDVRATEAIVFSRQGLPFVAP